MSESKVESRSDVPTSVIQIERGQALVEIVEPVNINRLIDAFKKLQEFKSRLLTKDDSVEIKGRQYLRKSAWRKWALACAVSDEVLSFERVPAQGKDQDGSFYYRIVVRAFHKPTGRSSVGVAVASRAEKKDWAHEEHDIFALAHTRAKNRAIADLVGGGEVSAEEIVPSETPQENRTVEAAPTPSSSTPMPPEAPKEAWTIRVPVTKDPIAVEGVRQLPLINGTTAIGIMNVLADGSEASIVPERPVPADAAPIRSFLVPKVLDAMKAKHPHVEYRLDIDENDMLRSIVIRGKLEDSQVKELASASKWAFQRATESQTPKPQRAGS